MQTTVLRFAHAALPKVNACLHQSPLSSLTGLPCQAGTQRCSSIQAPRNREDLERMLPGASANVVGVAVWVA